MTFASKIAETERISKAALPCFLQSGYDKLQPMKIQNVTVSTHFKGDKNLLIVMNIGILNSFAEKCTLYTHTLPPPPPSILRNKDSNSDTLYKKKKKKFSICVLFPKYTN